MLAGPVCSGLEVGNFLWFRWLLAKQCAADPTTWHQEFMAYTKTCNILLTKPISHVKKMTGLLTEAHATSYEHIVTDV